MINKRRFILNTAVGLGSISVFPILSLANQESSDNLEVSGPNGSFLIPYKFILRKRKYILCQAIQRAAIREKQLDGLINYINSCDKEIRWITGTDYIYSFSMVRFTLGNKKVSLKETMSKFGIPEANSNYESDEANLVYLAPVLIKDGFVLNSSMFYYGGQIMARFTFEKSQNQVLD